MVVIFSDSQIWHHIHSAPSSDGYYALLSPSSIVSQYLEPKLMPQVLIQNTEDNPKFFECYWDGPNKKKIKNDAKKTLIKILLKQIILSKISEINILPIIYILTLYFKYIWVWIYNTKCFYGFVNFKFPKWLP